MLTITASFSINSLKRKDLSRKSDVNIIEGSAIFANNFSDFRIWLLEWWAVLGGLFLFQKLIIILIEFMERKNTILPTLAAAKPKSRMTRDKLKIEELLLNNTTNRITHQDYRSE